MNWQMPLFSIVTQKKTPDMLPGFYRLLSMQYDRATWKTLICLIVYFTYGFKKILKSLMSFSQQSLESLKERNSKDTLLTDMLPDIF
jgi:hypothetical protein